MSPRIPDRYLEWARGNEIIVVAGANQALKYWCRIKAGMGGRANPFRGTQSMDAAVALLALAGLEGRTLHGWGYGPAVDPTRTYFYQDSRGGVWPIRFLTTFGMANAFNYSEGAARAAVRQLIQDVESRRVLASKGVMFIGCSWGAAVVEYAASPGPERAAGALGPGVAIGGPRSLLSWEWGRRLRVHRLTGNGDHGSLWIQRHPDDPVGLSGLGPARYLIKRRFHDYGSLSTASASNRPFFWGITG